MAWTAPLYLEWEHEVIMQTACNDTPANQIGGMVTASYTASSSYHDRLKLTIRANFEYYNKEDLVLGTMPKNSSGLKVYNLVVQVDGYEAQYMEAIKPALTAGGRVAAYWLAKVDAAIAESAG